MSGGILSGFFGGSLGNGILGSGDFMDAMADPRIARQYEPGLLGHLDNFANKNQYMLLNAGAALLDGQGWGGAARGAAQGMRYDELTRQTKQKEAEAEQKKLKYQQLAEDMGHPELADMPGVLDSLALDKYKRREPTEFERLTQGLSSEELQQAKRAKLGLGGASDFSVIGEDEYGNKQYGWVDKSRGTVTPYQRQPGSGGGGNPGEASGTDISLPPPPPGMNPKIWRDEQTKIAANEGKQSDKMRSDLALARRSAESLKTELKVFKDLVDKNGAEMAPGRAKAAMQTVYTNIQMQLKNLYELGAITGPDMQILERMLENPTAEGAFEYLGKAYNRGGRTSAQVEQVERIINNSLANAEKNLGGRSGGRSGSPGGAQGAVNGQTRSGVSWSAR
jgi:hypothetical protein